MESKRWKLTYIKVNNFRVFEEAEINLIDYNVFVGPNSSGKSSIAELLYIIRELFRNNFSGPIFSNRKDNFKQLMKSPIIPHSNLLNSISTSKKIPKSKPITFHIRFENSTGDKIDFQANIDENYFIQNDSLQITKKDQNYIKIMSEGNKTYYSIASGDSWIPQFNYNRSNIIEFLRYDFDCTNPYQEWAVECFKIMVEYLDNIFISKFTNLKREMAGEEQLVRETPYLLEDFSNLPILIHHLYYYQKENYDNIVEWMKKLYSPFKKFSIGYGRTQGAIKIEWQEDSWGDVFLPLDHMSDGLIYMVYFLAIIFNDNRPKLLILDEPTNLVHPSIRFYFIELLKFIQDTTQIILLTHNSELLKKMELNQITYFKRESNRVIPIRLDTIESIQKTISELNDVDNDLIVELHRNNNI